MGFNLVLSLQQGKQGNQDKLLTTKINYAGDF